MRVVSPSEMVRIEKLAYQKGADEEVFMEQAGGAIADLILRHLNADKVLLLCGKGNNAGDCYVVGRILKNAGLTVQVLQVSPIDEASPLCQKKAKEFGEFEPFEGDYTFDLIFDGLFGTGFHGSLQEPFRSVILKANESGIPILSIDIPSGLNGKTGEVSSVAIKATHTVFLGLPKEGFFLLEGWNHVGKLHFADFGLDAKFIEKSDSRYELLTESDLPKMPPLKADRHKYEAGSVVSVAGSPGMAGAALLASTAALKTGAGIVHLFYPKGMEVEFAAAPYELICLPYESKLNERIQSASAALIGPGLGENRAIVSHVLSQVKCPIVIDADALHPEFEFPEKSILTPHHGEMARLLGKKGEKQLSEAFITSCQKFVDERGCRLILKGGPTVFFSPGKKPAFSSWGNPGMATAGTGDVLTGVIASLLSQGLELDEAAKLGLFLHGTSGDLAQEEETSYGMTASDLVRYLPDAIRIHLER